MRWATAIICCASPATAGSTGARYPARSQATPTNTIPRYHQYLPHQDHGFRRRPHQHQDQAREKTAVQEATALEEEAAALEEEAAAQAAERAEDQVHQARAHLATALETTAQEASAAEQLLQEEAE